MLSLEKKFPKGKGRFVLFSHPDCLLHRVREDHPETPARLESILHGCAALPASLPLSFQVPPPATVAQLQLVHEEKYLLNLEAACRQRDPLFMTPDNHICPDTFRAVLAAAGCALALGETLLENGAGFALVRPPGHHAGRKSAEGFCFVNHIALAIETIRQRQPAANFLVVDFDVHHGNGTQTVAEREPRLMFASTHQAPLYPGTGAADETGIGQNVVNAPLPAGAGSAAWRRATEIRVLPALDAFAPQLILVSAGFDAHKADPLAQMELETEDFAWAARELRALALKHCQGKLVSTLEGGYDLAALAGSASAYLAALQRD